MRILFRPLFCSLVLTVAFAPQATIAQQTSPIGSIVGSFDVSLSGSATYSIPLKIPPGAAGSEPKLALNYDSQSPPGSLGAGWSLTGVSAITRGSKNKFVDGSVDGVRLEESDALFLDGQRLVPILSAGAGPNRRVEFRKEVDDQTKIVQLGGDINSSTFIAQTKGGVTLLFDGQNNSRVKVSSETLLMAVSRIVDSAGNYIQFEYNSSAQGGYDLARVTYTGLGAIDERGIFSSSTAPFAKIEFNYTTARSIEHYVAGQAVRQDTRLASIETSVFADAWKILSRYEMGYTERATTGSRFVLTTIKQFGDDGTQLTPTNFKYSEPTVKWTPASFSLPVGVAYALREKLSGAYRFVKFTEGASSLPDLLVAAEIGGKIEAFAYGNTAGTFSELDAKFKPPIAFVDSDGADLGAILLDVDGDGRADVLRSQRPKGQASQSKAFLANTANGWSEAANYALPFDVSIEGKRAAEVLIGNLTGGPGPDMIYQTSSGSGFLKNLGPAIGWQQDPNLKPPVRIDRFSRLLDVDCDGKSELLSIIDDATTASGWRWAVYKLTAGAWIELDGFAPPIDASLHPEAIQVVRFVSNALPNPESYCAGLMASSAIGEGYRAAAVATSSGWRSVKSEFFPPFDLVAADGAPTGARFVSLSDPSVDDIIAHQIGSDGSIKQFSFIQTPSGWQASAALPPVLESRQKDSVPLHPFIGDLNGDGLSDIVLPAGTKGDSTRVFAGSAGQFVAVPDFVPPIPFARSDLQDRGIRFVDLNGDGLADILFHRETADPKATELTKGAFINTGRGWRETPALIPALPFAGEKISGNPVEFVDVDGDGFVDLLYSYRKADGSVRRAHFKNEQCTISDSVQDCGPLDPNDPARRRKWVEQNSNFLPPADFPFAAEGIGDLGIRIVDINGDGRPDIVAGAMLPVAAGIADVLLCPVVGPGVPPPTACPIDPSYLRSVAFLNSGSGWVESTAFKLPLPFVMQLNSQLDRTSETFVQLVDIDGDRLPDLVASFTHPRQSAPVELTYINSGNGWVLKPTIKAPLPLDGAKTQPTITIQWLDLNGDGLSDIIASQRSGGTNQSATYLSTGKGFVRANNWQVPLAAISERHGDPSFRFVDLNGDGLLDIIYARKIAGGQVQRGVFVNNSSGFTIDPVLAADPTLLDKIPAFIDENGFDQGVRIVDVDGNGLVDIIQAFASGPTNTLPQGPILLNSGRRSDILENIEVAYGVSTNLYYQTLLETNLDAAGQSAPWRRVYLAGQPASYPIIKPVPASYVVRRALVTEGPDRSVGFSYRYGDFRMHGEALRSLGFGWRESYNEVSKIIGRTELIQDVKFRANVKREATCLLKPSNLPGPMVPLYSTSGDIAQPNLCPEFSLTFPNWTTRLSESVNDWSVREQAVQIPGGPAIKIRQINIKRVTANTFELNDGGELSSQLDEYYYDEPADLLQRRLNVLRTVSTRGDGTSIVTENEYLADITSPGYAGSLASRWHLGRLTQATMTKIGDPVSPGSANRKSETRIATFAYDAETGLLIRETANAHNGLKSVSTNYTRDKRGNIVISTIAAIGETLRISSTEFDANGRFPIADVNALGHRETRQLRKTDGQPEWVTGPNGLTTRFQYDGFGRKTLEVSPSGIRTSIEFIELAALTDARAIAGIPAAYASKTQIGSLPPSFKIFDNKGRVLRTVDEGFLQTPGGQSRPIYQDTEFDVLGRARKTSLPYEVGQEPVWAVVDYDGIGRVYNTQAPSGATITTKYLSRHGGGSVLKVIDPLNRESTVEKNARGLVVRVVDPAGGVLQYEYDAGDRLEVHIGAKGARTRHTYNDVGHRVATSDPDLGQWQYEFNAFGKLVRQVDAKQQVAVLEYDALGRISRKSLNDAVSWWTYDEAAHGIGKISSLRGSDGFREDYFYDDLSRPSRTSTTIGTESFSNSVTYDAMGRVATINYPTGFMVANIYDDRGFHIEVRNARSKNVYWKALEIDVLGRVTRDAIGNGIETSKNYAPDSGYLKSVISGTNAVQIMNLSLDYDLVGNLKGRKESVEKIAEAFGYDLLDRLVSLSRPNGSQETYAFDEAGRFTFKSGAGQFAYASVGGDGTTAGKPFHAVLSTNLAGKSQSYEYDENGNLTRSSKGTFEYTSDNRMKLLFADQFRWARFDYNPLGHRYRQFWRQGIESAETLYVGSYERLTEYVGPLTDARRGRLVRHRHALSNNSGVFATVEISGEYADIVNENPGPRIAGTRSVLTNTKVWYAHKDQLGSILRITDETARVSAKYWFEPWGQRTSKVNDAASARPGQRLDDSWDRGFTGHEHLDEYSLIHMNGRVYEIGIGNFTSVDMVNQSLTDSQTSNGYQYAKRNPLKFVDGSGYFLDRLVRAVVGGTVGFLIGGPAGAIVGVLYATSPEVKKFVDENWRTAAVITVTIAVGVVTGPGGALAMNAILAGAVVGATSAAVATALYGGSFEDVLASSAKGAIFGAASAGFFDAAGTAFDGSSAAWGSPDSVGAIVSHGTVGGMMEVANEGNFWHGFAAASVTKTANAYIPRYQGAGSMWANSLRSAIIGGTAAQLSGGNFSNGAITGAFSYLFNEARHEVTAAEAFRHYLGGSGTDIDIDASQLEDLTERDLIKRSKLFTAAVAYGDGDYIIDDKFSYHSQRNANFLGHVDAHVKGYLHVKNGVYNFSGKVTWGPDRYNMNSSTHRSGWGEAKTTFGRISGAVFGSKPYNVNIQGTPDVGARGYFGP